jgi:hypothetical protein
VKKKVEKLERELKRRWWCLWPQEAGKVPPGLGTWEEDGGTPLSVLIIPRIVGEG